MVKLNAHCLARALVLRRTQSQNAVAAIFGVSSTGLKNALKKHARLLRRKTPVKETRGRKAKLSDAARRRLIENHRKKVVNSEDSTAAQLQRECKLRVSLPTIRAELEKDGHKYRPRYRKSGLEPEDAAVRLAWAEDHEHYDFTKVDTWTDCVGFCMPTRQAPMRSNKAWLKKSDLMAPYGTKSNDTRHKGWCCWVYGGFGPDRSKKEFTCQLQFVQPYDGSKAATGGWSKTVASNIIEMKCVKKIRKAMPRKKFLIQTDGDGAFRSHFFAATLRRLNCVRFTVPPRSGDIAPIERAWAWAGRAIRKKANALRKWRYGAKDTPMNRAAWSKLVLSCVQSIPNKSWTSLVKGMGKRCTNVIKAGGNRIKG